MLVGNWTHEIDLPRVDPLIVELVPAATVDDVGQVLRVR